MSRMALWLLIAGIILINGSAQAADEEILDFSSHIEISSDGNLDVTESIRVRVAGDQIKRGIYRDFPTDYRDARGLRVTVPFDVVSVTRDGRPEEWRTEKQQNGVRLYLGNSDVLLPHGEVLYTIHYTTGRQLGFFDDYDELYWNVTGNGWSFPILRASACVDLPPGTTVRSVTAFTGPKGSTEQNFRADPKPGCDASVVTTVPLKPEEGFTIAVTWPPGTIERPTAGENFDTLVEDNLGVLLGFFGLTIALGYFSAMWVLFGRDPRRGTIIPLYAPPGGLTPQDVRYLDRLGAVDNKSFTSAIVHLGVQGALKIRQSPERYYMLEESDKLPVDIHEVQFKDKLFTDGSPLVLRQGNYKTMQAARALLFRGVKEQNGKYIAKNTHLWVIGLILTLIPLAVSLVDANEIEAAGFMFIWLSIWSVGCAALCRSVASLWNSGRRWASVPKALFAIPFFLGWTVGLVMLCEAVSIWVMFVYLVGIVMCGVFQFLLKQPTSDGQKLRDQILGFREYLTVAEADRMNLENPPERTPEHFEKFLPYALALGVEQAWAEGFASMLAQMDYQPDWYQGTGPFQFSTVAFSQSLGTSLSSAISSASTAPGSSSGSGGGGSSGGGGGGGGGGGW